MDDFIKPAHPPTPDPVRRSVDGVSPHAPVSARPAAARSTVPSQQAPVASRPASTSPSTIPVSDTSDTVPAPTPSPTPFPVAGDNPAEAKKEELIPGLNTKPNESSFDQAPLTSDTPPAPTEPEQKPVPDILSAPSKPTKKNKSGAIIVAILVALSLVGGAGYAYWQKRDEAKTQNTNSSTKKDDDAKPAASDAATSDKASSKIDESLKKIDDEKDFAETDLSDTTLGL